MFDYKAFHEQKYADALAAYASGSGARYETHSKALTWEAAKLGKSADDVIADLRAVMTDFTGKDASNIIRGVATATAKQGSSARPSSYRHQQKTDTEGVPDFVRGLISDGGGTCTSADLIDLSPVKVRTLTESPEAVTFAFVSSLWKPDEFLHVFGSSTHRCARIGEDLRRRDDWLAILAAHKPLPGDCIGKNPYTGREGKNGEGRASFTAKECVAAYRYALIEFDCLPLQEQAAFWRGFISRPKLSSQLVSLTYSGGKSIHGLIRTNADNLTAPTVERSLRGLFCSDPEKRTRTKDNGTTEEFYPYRADPATLKPHGGTRLAGARRQGRGRTQNLIYLCEHPQDRGCQ